MSPAEMDADYLQACNKAAAKRAKMIGLAIDGLSDEQIEAIPRVLSLAAELAAMAELVPGYEPGTDLFTTAEVLKLALAGARS